MTNGAMAASTSTIANSPPTKAPQPAAAASTIPGRSSLASSAPGVAVTSTVSVDIVDAVLERLLRRQEHLEVGLPPRQLGLQAHDAVDVDRLVVQRPDPFDAGPEVGDAGVEIGELVGDVLGELVERQDGAELLQGVGDCGQLGRRHLQHERGARADLVVPPRPAARSRCRRRRPVRRASSPST